MTYRELAKKLVLPITMTSVLALSAGAAFAQEIEEIVVTATKRSSAESDTPLSIETISGDSLVEAGMVNLQDVSVLIPNVTIGEGMVTQTINIRGMGSGVDRAFEQSVGMFIDGVYMPRSRQYRSPFFDAERIEVVRGPQSVLFGMNSTAGAIQVVSKSNHPGDDFGGEIVAGYETEYTGQSLSAALGGSLGSTFGWRIAARTSDSGDGIYLNQFTGERENTSDETLVRATLVWEPTASFAATLKYDSAEFNVDGHAGEIFGPTAAVMTGDGDLDYVRNVDGSMIGLITNVPPGMYQELENWTLNADWEYRDHTFTMTYGHSDSNYDLVFDLDATPIPMLDASLREDYEQDSVELRLASPIGGQFEYIVGGYWAQGDLFNSQPSVASYDGFGISAVVPALAGLFERGGSEFYQETDTLSIFGNLTFHLNDTMRFIGGARWNQEDKDAIRQGDCDVLAADGTVVIPGGGFVVCATHTNVPMSRSSSNFMPEGIFQWDVSENGMLYAKVGRSAKSGGFASAGTVDPLLAEYDDEIATTVEAGYKTLFASNRAQLNVSVFRTEFEDLQLNSFQVSGPIIVAGIVNAGESVSSGLEAELNFAATDWLSVGGSIGILDSEFTDFKDAKCNLSEPPAPTCDHTDMRTPFAPTFSSSFYVDILAPWTDDFDFIAGATVSTSSEYFTEGDLNKTLEQSNYTRVDVRAGIAGVDGNWSLSLIGKNLTEEEILSAVQPVVGWNGYLNQPRTLTIQATARF